jgi:hypothetical protein
MSSTDPRLLDHDPDSGITEYYHFDAETGGFGIEARQNVSSIIEVNKAAWNDTETHTPYREGLGARVASVPLVVMMQLAKSGIITAAGRVLDDKKYRAWLNDPENRFFRTRAGRV